MDIATFLTKRKVELKTATLAQEIADIIKESLPKSSKNATSNSLAFYCYYEAVKTRGGVIIPYDAAILCGVDPKLTSKLFNSYSEYRTNYRPCDRDYTVRELCNYYIDKAINSYSVSIDKKKFEKFLVSFTDVVNSVGGKPNNVAVALLYVYNPSVDWSAITYLSNRSIKMTAKLLDG